MKNKPIAYRVEYLCGGCNKAHAWGECTEEKELKNEPVAYVTGLNKFDSKMVDTVLKVGTPLYTHPASLVDWSYQQGYQVGKETHPAKTLTDEEITEVIKKIASNNEYVYSLYEDFEGIEFSRVGIFEFSRAILRKAQEK